MNLMINETERALLVTLLRLDHGAIGLSNRQSTTARQLLAKLKVAKDHDKTAE